MSHRTKPASEVTEKTRGKLRLLLAAFGSALLLLSFLVTVVELSAFDPGYYDREYAKNNAAAYVGVSEDVLGQATSVLLEYLKDTRQSLDLAVDVDGAPREYYNEREKAHMVDVKDLNRAAILFAQIAGVAGAGCIVVAACREKQGRRYMVCGACAAGILCVLGFFTVLGVWGAMDFTSFWVFFHHVFFRNDLWLFDPRNSFLIRMFEEQFFFDLVAQILAWFLGVAFAALILLCLGWKRGRKKALLSGEQPA